MNYLKFMQDCSLGCIPYLIALRKPHHGLTKDKYIETVHKKDLKILLRNYNFHLLYSPPIQSNNAKSGKCMTKGSILLPTDFHLICQHLQIDYFQFMNLLFLISCLYS